jgi:signal transduction histidine kinase
MMNKVFKTLYSKIALILSALFLLIGLLYVLIALFSTRLYIQEGAQSLNHDLARYLVSEMFFIEDGQVNESNLKKSFDMLMKINHNIEVYLLDTEGKAIAYSAPEGKVKRESVSLAPIEEFLKETRKLPILGDDPRHLNRQKVFSVSPVPLEGELEGYLYIILGSEEYDSVTSMLNKNYIFRLSISIAAAGLVFVFITGLFLFRYTTRRLRYLTTAIDSYKQSDFKEPFPLPHIIKKDSGDEIDHLGMIFKDMSHRIIKQMDEIRQADASRRELISNISHDLRTPLASLRGYLETLLLKGGEIDPEEKLLFLTTALKHSERLSKLVSELFELAKLDSSETKAVFEPFHLEELVRDIVQKLNLEVQKKNINIQIESPHDPPFAYADIGLIERALQNLIDNAIKYTEDGGEINIILTQKEDNICVQVIDSGCGISEEDIPNIFDRFYSVKARGKDDAGGTGLGLAITRRIIELHGAKIRVKSELRKGTTFTFHLPSYKTNE